MEKKNKIASVGFMLALSYLGLAPAHAAQANLVIEEESALISAEASCFQQFFSHPDFVCIDSELYAESRTNLDRRAVDICSGRTFSIDESSIEQTMTNVGCSDHRLSPSGGRCYKVTTKAQVICRSGL